MLTFRNEGIRAFMDEIMTTKNISKYVELPMIAVMGDTSSGKSSLLSSISTVELPSSSALTTRCPILLKMRRADSKEATVSISWHDSHDLASRKDVHFTPRVVSADNWDDLPRAITAAQSHINHVTGKAVARDKVNVSVSGPDCEDLTLIDLPGIVRSRGEGESETIVEEINGLIKDYLRNKRCVILAVVPANVDFHSSQIMADAKKVDPDTLRTIPVITKPELIDVGSEDDVKRLLLGETVRFHHGFHMVKGRGQEALEQAESFEIALSKEKAYFENTEPWRSVRERDLFGTDSLCKKLCELQITMYRDAIPEILVEIRKKRDYAKLILADMGHPCNTLEDRRVYFQSLVSDLVAGVTQSVSGINHNSDVTMTAKVHSACARYKESIDAGRLVQIMKIKKGMDVLATTKQGIVRGKVIRLEGSEAFIDYHDRETVHRDEFVTHWNTNPSAIGGDSVPRSNGRFDVLRAFPIELLTRDSSWLKEIIIRRRADNLPLFLNDKIFESIQGEFIRDDWQPACLALAATVSTIIDEMISITITKMVPIDGRYPRLYGRLCLIQNDIEQQARNNATERVERYITRNLCPYSQNDGLFETFSELRTSGLKQQLVIALDVSDSAMNSNVTIAKNTVRTVIDAIFDGYQKRSVEEYMAEEMAHALESYGKVAQTRFIDEVPGICWEVFRETPSKFQKALWALTDDDLDHILQDSPAYDHIYRDKSEEVEQLSKALGRFSALM